MTQATAETAAFLSTALVIYLSVNAVTHPETLRLQRRIVALASEGTVRVIGLGVCLAGVTVSHYLRATASRPVEAAAVPDDDQEWECCFDRGVRRSSSEMWS